MLFNTLLGILAVIIFLLGLVVTFTRYDTTKKDRDSIIFGLICVVIALVLAYLVKVL